MQDWVALRPVSLELSEHATSSACCPRWACWSHPLLTNPLRRHWSLLSTYKILEIFATDSIHWSMLQWYPLTSLHIVCTCQEITHTGVATPELVTFVVQRHFSHHVHNPIMVLVSAHHLMTSNVHRKLKSLSKEKIFQWIGRLCILIVVTLDDRIIDSYDDLETAEMSHFWMNIGPRYYYTAAVLTYLAWPNKHQLANNCHDDEALSVVLFEYSMQNGYDIQYESIRSIKPIMFEGGWWWDWGM